MSLTGQRHQALHFPFRPLCTLVFLSGLPNTQSTVTIATSQRATSSQADHVTATSVRGRRRTPPNQLTAYSGSLPLCTETHKIKHTIPLLMLHPRRWSLNVRAEREQRRHVWTIEYSSKNHIDWYVLFPSCRTKMICIKTCNDDEADRELDRGPMKVLSVQKGPFKCVPVRHVTLLPPVDYIRYFLHPSFLYLNLAGWWGILYSTCRKS